MPIDPASRVNRYKRARDRVYVRILYIYIDILQQEKEEEYS